VPIEHEQVRPLLLPQGNRLLSISGDPDGEAGVL